jgi:hypothetical protein
MHATSRVPFFVCVLLGLTFPLHAQRPSSLTEPPETSGEGKLTVGVGLEYLKKNKAIPPRASLTMWRLPVTRSYLGVGKIADVIVDWRGRLFAEQGTGQRVTDWGDLSLGTKVQFLRETPTRPSLGAMFLVKLPNTSHDELLGSNQTDVFLSVLGSKQFSEVELRGNLGLGILDDPERPHTQLDIYTFGIACLFPVWEEHRLFIEWAGFLGSHSEQAKTVLRYGFVAKALEMEWSIFGSLRVIGNEKDFGTAFEYSESWGVGMFLRKGVALW